MTRLSHDALTKGYEHIADMMKNAAGKGGVLSRDEAKMMVARLRAEGRSTEALAAEQMFATMDAFDTQKGARVTGADIDGHREWVDFVAREVDVNDNGISRAELKNADIAGKALAELGQTLSIDKVRGRTAHRVPEQGLLHTASLLRSATGPDQTLSRDDVKNLVQSLTSQGRGLEADAVRSFAAMIDARDARKGNRITDADIGAAVRFARKEMLADHDRNRNGFSGKELSGMSKTAKAFFLIGKNIEAGITKSAMPTTGEGVRNLLSGQVKDQIFDQWGSEADMPIRARLGKGTHGRVDEQSFRQAFGITEKPIEVTSRFDRGDLRTLIETNATEYVRGQGFVETESALASAMRTSATLRGLKDLKAFVTGTEGQSVRPVYVVGLAPDNTMVGIQTSVVWT